MKSLVIPICIIVFIILLVITNYILLNFSTDKLIKLIENSIEDVKNDDFDESKINIDKFEKEYEKYQGYFSIIIRHNCLDDIRILSKQISELNTKETKTDFLAESNALKDMISHLLISEKIIIENIL